MHCPMSPEGRKDRIIGAIEQLLVKGSALRPLVLAIEDLHWADKATEDALKWLLEVVPGARIPALFTYRPEFVPSWGGRSYHSQITLNRLSNRESLLLVSNLLGTEKIDPEREKLLLTKTEGNPFFIEEFVKALRSDPRARAVPSTIQDVIMARVDHLPDSAKAVLQAGSVIEREFPHELVRQVTGLPEAELLTHLSALKDAEFLYERGVRDKRHEVLSGHEPQAL